MKIHAGDTVLIITGKDKGKSGTVLRVLEEENRVVVGGVNIRTKHIKKTYQEAGKIIKFEGSISASNVMILDPKTGKPSRIGYKLDDKGRKIRISKISGETVKAVKPKVEKKTKQTTETKKTTKPAKEDASSQTDASVPGKKSPFWKRMGFGATAGQQGEVKEGSRMTQDHSVPEQQSQVHRSGGRGS